MVTRLCSLLILAGLALPIHAAPSETPNVVLIMTDNHGAWTLGCYGNPDIATPHIDRLAAEGTMMTRAFASNPVCSPTRATYLTGLLPSQHGVHCFLRGGRLQIGPEARNTLAEFRSLPEILKEQGYRCGLVGKWHLGANLEPQEGLDDYWITMPHGGTSTFYDAPIIENGKQRTEPKYLTEFWTDHAVKFLEQDDERPFFLFLAYNGPYSLGRLLLREGQNRHVERYRSGVPSFPIEEPHPWQFNNLDYMNNPVSNARVATEVSGVDDGVGRVMDCLRAQGVGDNTLVVFVADQGWVGGHGGFYGMGDHTRPATARDGMLQVPMIWHHPGKISAGQESDLIVTNYDFLPTVLGYLGLSDQLGDSPKSPGRDFSSVLTGGDLPDWRNEAFAEFEYLRSIRTESHRLVRRFADGPDELYDITSDPGEERNLIDDPESQTVLEQLDKRLTNFFDEYASPKYDLWNSGDSQTVVHTEATKSLDPLPVRRETAADADDASHQLALGSQPSSLSSSDDDKSSLIRLPDGYTVERVAGPPLVEHPLMAGFDDQGRLYVAENAGMNLRFDDLEKQLPNSVKRLEDTDGDGIFDKATTFADKMTFPMGALWYRGSVYVASPPYVWKLTDTDDDGVADQREKFAGIFGSNGNAADVHGCFLSPDGRIYWCDGRHGHEFRDDDGNVTSQGKGSNIFTCWPDGSDLYAHCGGGMDNPVEVDFTDTGDVLGTVNILYRSPRIDCLVHWLHGGAYPHYESVLGEYKKTGDLLGPIYQFGHVAVSGTCRYRSGLLERHFRDDMFVTIFNTGKVMRCEVDPSGSTYSADAAEFLSCSDPDFHPTDILEDADGSLLLIDTGGWFRIGCPTSQIEKPDILGGIYRIRKTGMPEFHDPRGIAIDWDQLSNTQLIALLGDTRYAVRDRAIDECAQRGEALIPLLAHRVKSGDILPRQNAIWALTRMRIPDAMKAVHPAFGDREPKIREIACHSVAATRDASAKELLLGALKEADHPHIVRQAIRALGRIGDSEAVRPLLAQAAMATDRALEHAAIYAVIEINDPQETAKFLSRAKPSVQRAALIALDQMDNQILSEQILRKALAGPTKVQATAMWVLMHRPEWNSLIAETVDNWLQGKIAHDESTIPSLIGNGQQFPDLIAKGLAGEDVPEERKLTILDALMQAPQPKLVEEWVVPLTKLLTSESRELQTQAMRTVARFGGAAFDPVLDEIALDEGKTIPVRMAALDARVSSGEPVSVEEFSFLMSLVDREGASASRDLATQILSRGVLTSEQLSRLVPLISVAGPIDLRSLMKPFERCRDEAVLGELIDALARAKSLASLTSAELTAISKRWPEEPSQSLGAVFEQLGQQEQKRVERLTALEPIAKAGSAVRGHEIFFSEKAKCVTCHRVGEKGGKIGPDLSAIGRIRRERDLLEAILFPSVSFAREFEPYAVATSDGKVFTGLIVRETEETITIQQQTGDPVSIARDDIEQIAPSPVSIMPQGLDTGLTDEQIGDLVAYLRSLQTPNTQSQEKLSAR